jgi:hypothetical protein
LLLAFLALLFLLATAAGETPYEALRLVGDAPERTTALILLLVLSLLVLRALVAFAHLSAPFGKAIVVVVVLG